MSKKKPTIKLFADRVLKHGKLQVFKLKDELIIDNPRKGKKIKQNEKIVYQKKAVVEWVFATKDGISNVTIATTPEELLSFAKKVMKDKKAMQKHSDVYFRHLGPDLTFCVRIKK